MSGDLSTAETMEMYLLAMELADARLDGLPAGAGDRVRRLAVLACRVPLPAPARQDPGREEPAAARPAGAGAAVELTAAQVAVAARVPVGDVRAAIGGGALAATRRGGRWYVRQADAARYAATQRAAAARYVPPGLKAS